MRRAAETLGVDPTTLADWEKGKMILYRSHRIHVARFLEIEEKVVEEEMRQRWRKAHLAAGGIDGK